MQHHCRIDGTPATAEDIAQARAWSSHVPEDRDDHYKSKEFVDTTASEDDDATPDSSTPTRRKSPSPPRQKHARRERSASPRRSTLTRAATPPRASMSASTSTSALSKVKRVRFEDKKSTQASVFRAKTEPAKTVTTATAPLETTTTTQRSRMAAATAHPDGSVKTKSSAKQKEVKQTFGNHLLSKERNC